MMIDWIFMPSGLTLKHNNTIAVSGLESEKFIRLTRYERIQFLVIINLFALCCNLFSTPLTLVYSPI